MAPSTLRAGVMFTLLRVGYMAQRQPNALNNLCTSALLLLLVNPYLLFDVGFQLSYAAVLGIIAWHKPLANLLPLPFEKFSHRCVHYVWKLVCLTTAAQLSTAPFVLYHFHQFSPWFLIANLLIVPFAGVLLATALGMIALVKLPLLGGAATWLLRQELMATDTLTRWVGTLPNILVALSGMTTMEVLKENVQTFSPLDPCTDKEKEMLERIADQMAGFPVVPCTACSYCMPCPYGVDIPGNFSYYNNAVTEKLLPLPPKSSPDYAERLLKYQKGFEKTLKPEVWASKCMDCEECLPKCPQQIRIPNQLARLTELLPSES